nr:hypothetical protein [Streptomyces sp. SID5468]
MCAFSGWWYAAARTDSALSYGTARDAVLAAARLQITRLGSVDAGHVDAGLGQWLDATTGPLHDQLGRTRASDAAGLRKSGNSARTTVTDAAVTELDDRAGTARAIATVTVRITPRDGTATTDRKRFEAALARTPAGWKLTALSAVPVGGG